MFKWQYKPRKYTVTFKYNINVKVWISVSLKCILILNKCFWRVHYKLIFASKIQPRLLHKINNLISWETLFGLERFLWNQYKCHLLRFQTHINIHAKLFVSPYKYFKAAEVNTDDQQASSSKKKVHIVDDNNAVKFSKMRVTTHKGL